MAVAKNTHLDSTQVNGENDYLLSFLPQHKAYGLFASYMYVGTLWALYHLYQIKGYFGLTKIKSTI